MFRQIPIEIIVGCTVVLVTPVHIPVGKLPIIEFIHSIVVKIETKGYPAARISERFIYVENPVAGQPVIKVPEWRVVRYTYGGIWLGNYKFDQHRIDAENLLIVSQKNRLGSLPKAP